MKRIFALALMLLVGSHGVAQAFDPSKDSTTAPGDPAVAEGMAAQFLAIEPNAVNVAIAMHANHRASARTTVAGGRGCTMEMVHVAVSEKFEREWMISSAECDQ